MVYGVRFKVKSSLGKDTGYGDLCGYLGENCSSGPVRGSLDSKLLKRENAREGRWSRKTRRPFKEVWLGSKRERGWLFKLKAIIRKAFLVW